MNFLFLSATNCLQNMLFVPNKMQHFDFDEEVLPTLSENCNCFCNIFVNIFLYVVVKTSIDSVE